MLAVAPITKSSERDDARGAGLTLRRTPRLSRAIGELSVHGVELLSGNPEKIAMRPSWLGRIEKRTRWASAYAWRLETVR